MQRDGLTTNVTKSLLHLHFKHTMYIEILFIMLSSLHAKATLQIQICFKGKTMVKRTYSQAQFVQQFITKKKPFDNDEFCIRKFNHQSWLTKQSLRIQLSWNLLENIHNLFFIIFSIVRGKILYFEELILPVERLAINHHFPNTYQFVVKGSAKLPRLLFTYELFHFKFTFVLVIKKIRRGLKIYILSRFESGMLCAITEMVQSIKNECNTLQDYEKLIFYVISVYCTNYDLYTLHNACGAYDLF